MQSGSIMSRSMTASPLASLFAIIVGVSLLQGANGILVVVVPLRMLDAGLGALDVGIMATGYAAGFLGGCLVSGRLIAALGHIRAYAVCAAGLSIAALAFTLTIDTWFWTGLRAITGLCLAGLLTAGDSWIADRAPPEMRGRVLSLYTLASKLAQMIGPLVLAIAPVSGEGPILVIAALVSASLIPVAATRAPSPLPPDPTPMGLRKLFGLAPAAVTGAFAAGLMNTAVLALAPAWGIGLGLSAIAVAGLVSALQGGSLIGQWPIGWLSDRVDRRKVIVGSAAISGVFGLGAAGLAWVPDVPDWLVWAAIALWAAPALSVYSICVAHTSDRVQPEQIVAATASLLLAWAVGSSIGPLMAGAAMELAGPSGLFLYAGSVAALIALYTVWRLRRRPAPQDKDKESFVPMQPGSQVAGELHPAAQEAEPEPEAKADQTPKTEEDVGSIP